MRVLLVAAVLTSAVIPNTSATQASSPLPSDHQVLTFIGNTVDWYRQLPTSQRIGSAPADVFVLENNRPIAMEIVRLSFRFGKAVAAIQPPQSAPARPEPKPGTPANRDLPYLLSADMKLRASAQHAGEELTSLTQARLTARGAERKKLDAQISETRTRIQLLNAISANYENLADFVRTASADADPDANLAALVEGLERSVPEISAEGGAPKMSNPAADPARAGSGVMGAISRVTALSRKQRNIEATIERTNALLTALQNLRTPFRDTFLKQISAFQSDGQNLSRLQREQSVLEHLVAQLQTVSPALAALIKQETLLNEFRLHLSEWRSDVQMESRAAWKALIVRLSVLALIMAALAGIHVGGRRVVSGHVSDLETRRALLLGGWVLFWVVILAVVLFAFAFDLSSLATFLGLLSAGLAVALHHVLLAIGGRLVLERRFQLGARVEIAGVKGEVTKIGLMEFALNELDASGTPTGRTVFFANSYVFVSPAIPLFRQVDAPT